MFNLPFTDLLPRSVIAASVVWGAAHYFVAGPAIASRIVRVDHLPACEANVKAFALNAAKRRAEELSLPDADVGRDIAVDRLRRLMDNPLMRELQDIGGVGDLLGLGETPDNLLDGYARGKDAAEEAYHNSLERLKTETATNLAQAGSVCGCLADAAIEQTRNEWAIFTGTLGFVRPAPLDDFGRRISEVYGAGSCVGTPQVAP